MNQQNEIPDDDALDDADDFGETAPGAKPPFWQRELLLGYSLPWIIGVILLALAGFGYLYGPSLFSGNDTPSENSFSEVENTLDGSHAGNTTTPTQALPSGPVMTTPTPAPVTMPAVREDAVSMMTDIRDELNARDRKLNAPLDALKDSVTRLSDAIKRDEAYAVETRTLLADLTRRLAALEARQSAGEVARPATTVTKRQKASPVSGMKVMSLEKGMAWIKWQGSTWSVREGDALGNVTIRQIDPVTRTVFTTGGNLR